MFHKIAEFILQERLREIESRVAELEKILALVESYKMSYLGGSRYSKKKHPVPPIVKTPPLKKEGLSP